MLTAKPQIVMVLGMELDIGVHGHTVAFYQEVLIDVTTTLAHSWATLAAIVGYPSVRNFYWQPER